MFEPSAGVGGGKGSVRASPRCHPRTRKCGAGAPAPKWPAILRTHDGGALQAGVRASSGALTRQSEKERATASAVLATGVLPCTVAWPAHGRPPTPTADCSAPTNAEAAGRTPGHRPDQCVLRGAARGDSRCKLAHARSRVIVVVSVWGSLRRGRRRGPGSRLSP